MQKEGESEDRICSLVHSIEEEMHRSGVNVNFAQLKSHLLQIREDYSNTNLASDLLANGEVVEVECNSPVILTDPLNPLHLIPRSKPRILKTMSQALCTTQLNPKTGLPYSLLRLLQKS